MINNSRLRFSVITDFFQVGSSINQGSVFGILSVLPESNSRAFLEGQVSSNLCFLSVSDCFGLNLYRFRLLPESLLLYQTW